MFDHPRSTSKAGDDAGHYPRLFHLCGWLGIAGCAIVVIANLVAVIVQPQTGFIEDTISDSAAGRYAVIMDVGLYAFAAAIFAVSIGLARLRFGRWAWRIGSWLLTLMAILIVVIGAHGEYGDNEVGGLVIHLPLVLAMAMTFTAAACLTAAGFRRYRRRWMVFNLACVAVWVVGAAIFWFSPTSIDGLIERLVGMVLIVWTLALSKLLIDRSKALVNEGAA
ncbi:MAG: DUF998 domain-containing protein [Pseudomonadota bacterium]|nr:DUF998 domain-containing protein [Pseudomonadota bacterium]